MRDKIINSFDIWIAAQGIKSRLRIKNVDNISLEGIARLRKLILELAIRGKLVEQNPSDEPAKILIQKIANERERLIKEGKLGKQNSFSPVSTEERLFPLPAGWEFIRFGNAVFNRDAERKPVSVDERSTRKGKFDYYGASGVIDQIDSYLFNKPLLLIGEDGANLINRSTPIAFMALGKYWVNNHAHVLDGLTEDLLRYIGLHINAISLKPYVTGTAQPKMNQAKMNSIVLALPPLKEQIRIVAKVNELMSLCDELERQETNHLKSHQLLVQTLLGTLINAADADEFQTAWSRLEQHFDDLFTTEDSIDQLKQTILQLAVMGKLVPQDPKDEPASVLLEKIADEKERLVEEGKIKKQKPLHKISANEKAFKVPAGWEWVRLGDALRKITDGTHHSPPNGSKGKYLYISAKNIKEEGVQLSNATYVTREIHDEIYSRCDPENGDVLYIKDGATTGIATINNINEPFSMLSSVALLKLPRSILNSYLLLSVRSPYFYKEMRDEMTGVAITRVTLKKLNQAIISLPPLAEQHRIVSKVEELFALCDRLKDGIVASQKVVNLMADTLVEQV